FALMVVWGYPCESKSSPAHYSKHPQQMLRVFFYGWNKMLRRKTTKNNEHQKIKPSMDGFSYTSLHKRIKVHLLSFFDAA
ncbi:hypothetical protein, partial [Acinetobacter towneri]|uniref:hypothetical protein n=1 Tax=Acinetobacter towneri TaxID=202956 RepID=UPI002575151A